MLCSQEELNMHGDLDYEKFSNFIEKNSGLFLPKTKYKSLQIDVKERMSAIGISSYDEYYNYLLLNPLRTSEFQKLINLITINETSFFRYLPQFNALAYLLKNEIIYNEKHDLKVWCAGCSTGAEAYSIAITILENFLSPLWKTEIIGTDVNTNVLEVAKKGEYPLTKIDSVLPEYQERYFKKTNDSVYLIDEKVRKMVNYKFLNLIYEPFPFFEYQNFDIIFCRNVTIYFKNSSTKRVISNLHKCLNPGGYLFLGHSEAINESNDFEIVDIANTNIYRKKTDDKKYAVKKINSAGNKKQETVKEKDNLYDLFLKAKISAEQNNFYEALKICEQIINKDCFFMDAYFLKGIIFQALNEIDRAIDSFKKCKYIDNEFVMAFFYLGNLYKKQNKIVESKCEYKNVIKLLLKISKEKEHKELEGFSKEMILQICEQNVL